MDGYKHYIRVNEEGLVVHGFSNAFEQPLTTDLPLSGDQGRHFQLQITNDRGQYKYKVANNQLVERSQTELDTEWAARPAPPPSEIDLLRQQVNELTIALGDALLGGGL